MSEVAWTIDISDRYKKNDRLGLTIIWCCLITSPGGGYRGRTDDLLHAMQAL